MEAEAWVGAAEFRAESSLAALGTPGLPKGIGTAHGAAPNGARARAGTVPIGYPTTDFASEHVDAIASTNEFALDHRGVGIGAILADLAALVVAAVGAVVFEELLRPKTFAGSLGTDALIRLLLVVPVFAVFLGPSRHRRTLRPNLPGHLSEIAPGLGACGLICLAGWTLLSSAGLVVPPDTDAILLLCASGLVTVPLARTVHHAPPMREGRRARRVVVLGSGVVADRVADQLEADGGVDVLGFVDDEPVHQERWLGKLNELAFLCENHSVDHIVVAFSRSSSEDLIAALRPMHGRVPITVVPRLFDVLPVSAVVHDLGSGLAGISISPASLGQGPRAIKRSIDLLGAACGLVLLSPLLAVVSLAIKLTSPGPVFFRQDRIGRNGDTFSMTKFRSMRAELPTHPSRLEGKMVTGPFPKLSDDPRVTTVGRLIRRTSIDELPQLFDVLVGKMSLVGPRPFIPDDAAWIGGWAQRRYSVRPGITGLWQVSGRNDLTFDEMCRLDSLYVSCWSIGLDLRILLRTLRAVATRRGAY